VHEVTQALKGNEALPRRRNQAPEPGGSGRGFDNPASGEIWARFDRRPEEYPTSVRCAKLYRELFSTYQGTVPEVIVYDWLTENSQPFIFQANFFGGRQAKGGVIPDYVVWPGGRGIAIFVDTLYWHSLVAVRESDLIDRIRLIGSFHQGIRIELVVAVWENRLYEDRNRVMQWAMQGIEIPK
jgi:hypothetical protein